MPLPPLPLPTIPEAPSRADPTTFEERNDAAVEFQFNTLPPWIAEQVNRTFQNAMEAAQSAAQANAEADRAEAAADSASQTAGATEWVSGQAYVIGAAVWSPLDFQTYRRRVAGSSTIDPSEDAATWELLGGGGAVDPSPTGDFTAQANKSYWLRGSFTVTLPPSPSFGNQVSFFKALDATPTIAADDVLIQTPRGASDSVLFDLDAEITFTFNGTDWEV